MSHRLIRIDAKTWFLPAALLALSPQCPACGPFFPNQVILGGDNQVLSMPAGDFATEIDLLRPAGVESRMKLAGNQWERPTVFQISASVDESDLSAALKARGDSDDRAKQIIDQYHALRAAITAHSQALEDNLAKLAAGSSPVQPIQAQIPDGLPTEFGDYIRGHIAFDNGDVQTARGDWENLLALPADQRKFRSVWAAFMLGKSYLTDDRAAARNWFEKTRELNQGGFADSLNLVSASFGWEAKTFLEAGEFGHAISLYMKQYWAGDDTALMSLRDSARLVLKAGPAALASSAGDEWARPVITAYILCDAGPFGMLSDKEKALIPAWLAAVEASGVRSMKGADRLAWMAFRSGDFDSAARWASRAEASSPIAQWVRAKLLLRGGNVDGAAEVLASLVKTFPPDNQWLSDEGTGGLDDQSLRAQLGPDGTLIPTVAGDLAVLRLVRGDYIRSLDLLLRADYWMDAAYVAERILTVDELKEYVDDDFPMATSGKDGVNSFYVNSKKNREGEGRSLRDLLARRLARLGRWKEARNYFPSDVRKVFEDYIAAIRRGHDSRLSNGERAESLMRAARSAKDNGMEMIGTELEPDFYCYDGHFNFNGGADDIGRRADGRLTAPSRDELSRYRENAPATDRRFQYRYVAADLAWSAVGLMPDDSDETATALCEAGSWLKGRDPKSAERFYRALVERCPSTALGEAAAAAHWFPYKPPPQPAAAVMQR